METRSQEGRSQESPLRITLILFLLFLTACSGCNKTNTTDTGIDTSTETSNETSTDIDAGDTDTSVSPTDTDTSVTDAGLWEWEDLPPSLDCGTGCQQITYEGATGADDYDVWGDLVVYVDPDGDKIYVADVKNRKKMRIPDVIPECSISTTGCFQQNVTIYKNTVFYSNGYFNSLEDKRKDQIVKVDLEKKTQEIIWSREWPDDVSYENPFPSPYRPDTWGDNLVYFSACDFKPYLGTLCLFISPWVGEENQFVIKDDSSVLSPASMWKNKLAITDIRKGPNTSATPEDISIYDLETKEWSYVIEHEKDQCYPRIHENRVVWMDWRFSEGRPIQGAEGWTNVAVSAKDVETKEEWQITDGSALAIWPDVFGDIVVWLDFRHCPESQKQNVGSRTCAEVYGYNLVTKNDPVRISNWPTVFKDYTRIWGDRIFLSGGFSGAFNYFTVDVPEELKTP